MIVITLTAYGFVTYLMEYFHLCITGIPADVTALIGLVILIFDLLTSK